MSSLWQLFLDFWSLSDPNVRWVLGGSALLGGCGGAIGCFAFLQRRSLTGDALAHAALPGVTTAFLLFHDRSPEILLAGAVVSCLLGYATLQFLVNRTKIKEDSAFAIVLSLFFAVGIFQLTSLQKDPSALQAGLDKLLFGQAASLVGRDVEILSIIAVSVLAFVAVDFERLKITVFDPNLGRSMGLNISAHERVLIVATVLAVVVGLQLVGVVLMAAVIMTPAAAARYWTERLSTMLWLSGFFGMLSGVAGANISYLAPSMPTGPWMVVAMTLLFAVSLLFAPERGLVSRARAHRRLSRRIREENVLRTLYKHQERTPGAAPAWMSKGEILSHRRLEFPELEQTLNRLSAKGYIVEKDGRYAPTPSGLELAKAITRRHRLWELYLMERISLPPDHVHADAEEIEHLLTPEIEAELSADLEEPRTDPHGRPIPDRDGGH